MSNPKTTAATAAPPAYPVAPSKIRILHVLYVFEPSGGIESWLRQVYARIDRDKFQMDIVKHVDCVSTPQHELEEYFRDHGADIFTCPGLRRPWQHSRSFCEQVRSHGPYDIMQCHTLYPGLYLRLAQRCQVPVRITMAHMSTQRGSPGIASLIYAMLSRRFQHRYMTHGLAVSHIAAESAFGPNWNADPRVQIMPTSIDFTPFHEPVDAAAVRRELAIPRDAFVIGHVGRFSPEKNHAKLIEIFAALAQRDESAWLLLIGDGPEKQSIIERLHAHGIAHRTTLTGVRSDVPRIMKGAMDVMVFPSLTEGLGLVVLEAQAAGLPSVISGVVPNEVDVVPRLIRRISPHAKAQVWAEMVIECRLTLAERSAMAGSALEQFRASIFNANIQVERLQEIYSNSLATCDFSHQTC